MSLSSLQLDAFQAVAQEKNFSRAAERLHITQSALSQRIQKLETELEVTLLMRSSAGVRLTETGVRLLQYCQVRESLEQEFVSDIFGNSEKELGGVLRIAGYSSVVRSVLQPTLAPLLRENPSLQIQLMVAQVEELPSLLLHGKVDFIVLDHVLDRAGIESYVLGQEVYVMVESSRHKGREEIYLDHTPDDIYSQAFLRRQGERLANVKRSFVHDVYGILDGVQEGLGRAIVPKHLMRGVTGVREIPKWKAHNVPVVLHFFQQPYYSATTQAVIDMLNTGAAKHL